jgi:serine/threonine protein kinase
MAPEVFRHELYNNKVDVYSWAMIAYQLLEGKPPFWMLDPVEAARTAAVDGRRPEWGPVNRRGDVVSGVRSDGLWMS